MVKKMKHGLDRSKQRAARGEKNQGIRTDARCRRERIRVSRNGVKENKERVV
jgi:hypothetical protein